jgi:hypothetical protein
MSDAWASTLFFLGLWFFVPVFLAKVVLRGSWRQVGIAYGVWVIMLALFGLTNGATWAEAIGWPLIMGMFLTIPAIAVIVIVLRVAQVR